MSEAAEITPYAFSDRVWPFPWMADFLEALAQLPVITIACRSASVTRSWAYQCAETYPEFKAAWNEAVERAADMVEANVIRWSMTGIPLKETRTKTVDGEVVEVVVTESVALSPALAKYVLNKVKPEYRESVRHEHTGGEGGAINHEVALLEVNRWPTEERARELARLALEFGIEPRQSPLVIEAAPPVKEEDDADGGSAP